jgi:hypothetical protein
MDMNKIQPLDICYALLLILTLFEINRKNIQNQLLLSLSLFKVYSSKIKGILFRPRCIDDTRYRVYKIFFISPFFLQHIERSLKEN